MDKKEFLTKLREKLSHLSDFDAQERINFYSEMIDDRMEEGLSEEDAISAIGSADAVASEVLEEIVIEEMAKDESEKKTKDISENTTENIAKKRDEKYPTEIKNAKKGRLTAGQIALLVLGAPVWASLLVAAAAVAFSLFAVAWSLVVVFWSVAVALAVSGVGGIVVGIVELFLQGAVGAILVGSAFVACGLSVFAGYGALAYTKAMIALTVNIFLAIKARFFEKEDKK